MTLEQAIIHFVDIQPGISTKDLALRLMCLINPSTFTNSEMLETIAKLQLAGKILTLAYRIDDEKIYTYLFFPIHTTVRFRLGE